MAHTEHFEKHFQRNIPIDRPVQLAAAAVAGLAVAEVGLLVGIGTPASLAIGASTFVMGALRGWPRWLYDPPGDPRTEAEKATAAWLRQLDDRHHVFYRVVIPPSREDAEPVEVPFLLLGPSGICVIHPVPWGGTLHDIGPEDPCTVTSPWPFGRHPVRTIVNPVTVAAHQARAVYDSLASNGRQVPVGALVLLTHPRARYQAERELPDAVRVVRLRDYPDPKALWTGPQVLAQDDVDGFARAFACLPAGPHAILAVQKALAFYGFAATLPERDDDKAA